MNKIEEAKMFLIKKEPFFGTLLTRFRVEYTSKIPTMCVSITRNAQLLMKINKEWLLTHDILNMAGCYKHELQHITNGHLKRTTHMTLNKNIAMDVAINQYNKWLPNPHLSLKSLEESLSCTLEPCREWEYYYDMILKQNPKCDLIPHSDHNDDSQGMDFDELPAEVQKSIVEQAILKTYQEVISKGYGRDQIPDNIQHYIDEIVASKNNWKQIIKQYVERTISIEKEPTRSRPNKRYGYFAPGYKTAYTVKPIIGIDQSGSTSDEDQHLFISNIKEILGEFQDDLEIGYFSEHLAKVIKADSVTTEINARHTNGGTDFQPIVDYASENNADLLIIFTDGDAPEPNNPKKIPIIWALNNTRPCFFTGEKIVITKEVA